jgi:hypothetical protein
MNGGRESRRPRPGLGCSVIDEDSAVISSKICVAGERP